MIAEIDILILSYAQTEELKKITIDCIQSLVDSENPNEVTFNVIVLESKKDLKPYQYEHSTTIYPKEEFNFHKYLNLGIKLSSSFYICLCNNDLLFQKGWATNILKAFDQLPDVYSASPMCPSYPRDRHVVPVNEIYYGYGVGREVQGPCIFFKRSLLKIIGQLDPNFKFHRADNDYANTLEVLKVKHILVKSSIVFHLVSKTLKEQEEDIKENLTTEQWVYYEKKWHPRFQHKWTLL